MGKKRRLWWIGGAVVAVVALFAAIAFFIDYNSSDARIERAVARVVEEYGFEKRNNPQDWTLGVGNGQGPWIPIQATYYGRPPMNERGFSALAEDIESVYDSYAFHSRSIEEKVVQLNLTFGDDRSVVSIRAQEFEYMGVSGGPVLILVVTRRAETGIWDRIRAWWPW